MLYILNYILLMKKLFTYLGLAVASNLSYGQYNTVWTYSTLNTGSSGYVGIGTKNNSGTTNTPVPAFNLHLHGTTDFMYSDDASAIQQGNSENVIISGHQSNFQTKATINAGKTTRIGMTNSTTGMTQTDGAVFQMSNNNLTIENREAGLFSLIAPGVSLTLTTGRAWLGGTLSSATTFAKMNVVSSTTDNGLYIQAPSSKYGLSIRSGALTDNAVQIVGTDGTTTRFSVKASGLTEIYTPSTVTTDKLLVISNSTKKLLQLTNDGILRSREVIVDLTTWADYVFEPTYSLMPLDALNTFIAQNKHLPNVPAAAEMTQKGLNVSESNVMLMEKIEELTLYILQLNNQLIEQQKQIQELKNTIK